jgi:hypothetical protein
VSVVSVNTTLQLRDVIFITLVAVLVIFVMYITLIALSVVSVNIGILELELLCI